MVRLNRIYTRTGDDGTTGLADGTRRSKADARIHLIGSVDELNASLGLVRLHTTESHIGEVDQLVGQVQNDLFDLGADLAVPQATEDHTRTILRIKSEQVAALEVAIDAHNEALAPLTSFVLPAGTALSAHLHMARTLARRAERDAFALHEVEPLNPAVLTYLNRLSDLLFVLARRANDDGRADVLWVPAGKPF
ncbi:MAG: cob(I)yrinic acid a,c-diamide adenosyltransferase [Asticcacaulis sp.]